MKRIVVLLLASIGVGSVGHASLQNLSPLEARQRVFDTLYEKAPHLDWILVSHMVLQLDRLAEQLYNDDTGRTIGHLQHLAVNVSTVPGVAEIEIVGAESFLNVSEAVQIVYRRLAVDVVVQGLIDAGPILNYQQKLSRLLHVHLKNEYPGRIRFAFEPRDYAGITDSVQRDLRTQEILKAHIELRYGSFNNLLAEAGRQCLQILLSIQHSGDVSL